METEDVCVGQPWVVVLFQDRAFPVGDIKALHGGKLLGQINELEASSFLEIVAEFVNRRLQSQRSGSVAEDDAATYVDFSLHT